MGISKITRNFQVTLPKDVREVKHLNVGDSVLFILENNKVDIVKMDKEVIKSAAGLWTDTKESGINYERRIRKGWERRTAR